MTCLHPSSIATGTATSPFASEQLASVLGTATAGTATPSIWSCGTACIRPRLRPWRLHPSSITTGTATARCAGACKQEGRTVSRARTLMLGRATRPSTKSQPVDNKCQRTGEPALSCSLTPTNPANALHPSSIVTGASKWYGQSHLASVLDYHGHCDDRPVDDLLASVLDYRRHGDSPE